MDNRPNVVFVFSDQHRANACGYAGNPDVHTPHLDAMASESMNFSLAVSGMPVCCPYRGTLLTGMYPHHHGIFLNDLCLDTRFPSLGEIFKDSGYDTAYVGKWHLDGHGRESYIPVERRHGFDYWKVLECSHSYNCSPYYEGSCTKKKYWKGYDAIAQTDDVIAYLKSRPRNNPLLLMLSWGPPHAPYQTAPEQYQRMYRPGDIRRPPNVPIEASQFFRNLPGYYAHITALDDCFGRLNAALDELNMRDNTIFIYTSDHGDMIGSQGVYEKQSPWDESNHVPLLIRYPSRFREAKKIDVPVAAVDIMPTLLDLCGLSCPDTVDGKSFVPYMEGNLPEDPAVLLQCIQPNGTWHKNTGGREYRGIRTARYTYVEDLLGPWLLYDNLTDPYQMHNMAEDITRGKDEDGQMALLQEQLHKRLCEKLIEAGDEFLPGYIYMNKWGYTKDVNFLDTYPI